MISSKLDFGPAGFVRRLLLLTIFLLPLGTVLILSESHAVVGGLRNAFAIPKILGVEFLALAAGLVWWWQRRPTWSALGSARWLLPLIPYAALTALWAPYPLLALTAALHLAVAWLWLVALSHELRSRIFARQAARVFVAAVVLQAVWGWLQYGLQHDLGLGRLGESVLGPGVIGVAKVAAGGEKLVRAYGSLPHPNVLAAFLAAGIFLAGPAVFTAYRRPWRRVVLAALLILLSCGLLVTFSRTVILVTAINALLVVVFSWRRWHRLPLEAGLIGAAVLAVALYLAAPLESRTSLNGPQETGLTNRRVGLEAAGEMITDKPWGVGAGNFVLAMDKYKPGLPGYQRQPAHLVPVLVAAELGVLPALLVLVYVVQLGRRFHRLRPRDRAANTLNFSLFMLGGVFVALGLTDHLWWSAPQALLLLTAYVALLRSRLSPAQA